jgi:peroxiredoxin
VECRNRKLTEKKVGTMLLENTAQGGSEATEPRRLPNAVIAVVLFTLALSVILNVLLAHTVRDLGRWQTERRGVGLLVKGTVAPPLVVKRLDGQQAVVSYQDQDQPTVLYVFTPSCPWCTRNLGNLRALVAQENKEYHFVGLALSEEGLAEYVAKSGLNFPVYSALSPEARAAYKLSVTPQTIVVSRDGHILQNWPGAYVGRQKSEVEAFFNVSLPGIAAGSSAH